MSDLSFLKNQIYEVLQALDSEELQIVAMRFGLTDGETATLEDISKLFGNTRDDIRVTKVGAMRKLYYYNLSPTDFLQGHTQKELG